MTRTPTCMALDCRWSIKVKEILTLECRVIVPGDKVLHDCQVRKLCAPAPPFTYLTEMPVKMH